MFWFEVTRFIESAFEEIVSAEDSEFEIGLEEIRKGDSSLSGNRFLFGIVSI
jgi:hypothetical protein